MSCDTRTERHVKKTYFFWALGELDENSKKKLEAGVKIYEKSEFNTAPAKIRVLENKKLFEIANLLSETDKKLLRKRGNLPVVSGEITITEGKKHQVKRMLGNVGCKVLYLKRVCIGGLSLDENLPEGSYKMLAERELSLLEE